MTSLQPTIFHKIHLHQVKVKAQNIGKLNKKIRCRKNYINLLNKINNLKIYYRF